MKLTAERDELLLPLRNYKVSKENLERKLSEQEVIVEVMVASVKQPEKKVSSMENKKILLQKRKQLLMGTYGRQNIVIRTSVEKLIKTVPTRFIERSMRISRAISK